jgi:TonB-dependent SusC/RagA subfamily outer membrane receptor
VTGAVSTVDSKTLEILKPVKVEQAPGNCFWCCVITSGAPGAKLDIRIRYLNGENGPTTIIDGYVGELGLLNQVTITVLKDAQAAIYGTIGANGVILITTTGKRIQSQESVSILQVFRNNSRGLLTTVCSMRVMQTEVQFLSLM